MSSAAKMSPPMTSCLQPIDKSGLDDLIAKGRADPAAVKTVRCRTVAEGRFRHLNMIRSLAPHVIDEPPALLGDDTAPNPSEAALAALGSCLAVGIHANAVSQGITVNKLEIECARQAVVADVWTPFSYATCRSQKLIAAVTAVLHGPVRWRPAPARRDGCLPIRPQTSALVLKSQADDGAEVGPLLGQAASPPASFVGDGA